MTIKYRDGDTVLMNGHGVDSAERQSSTRVRERAIASGASGDRRSAVPSVDARSYIRRGGRGSEGISGSGISNGGSGRSGRRVRARK